MIEFCRMKNILLTSTICFILTLAASGQIVDGPPNGAAPDKPLETHYDKFKKFTLIRSAPQILVASGNAASLVLAIDEVEPHKDLCDEDCELCSEQESAMRELGL